MFIRKPFIKFICHTASYLTFLFLLFLASQHIASPQPNFQGPPPTTVEWMILPWVLGNNGQYIQTNTHTHYCSSVHSSYKHFKKVETGCMLVSVFVYVYCLSHSLFPVELSLSDGVTVTNYLCCLFIYSRFYMDRDQANVG